MLDLDESGTISAEEFKRFVGSLKAFGSLPGADAATAAAIEGSFTRELEDDTEAATDETFVRVDAISPDTESVSETSGLTTENALAALALSNLARPALPPQLQLPRKRAPWKTPCGTRAKRCVTKPRGTWSGSLFGICRYGPFLFPFIKSARVSRVVRA